MKRILLLIGLTFLVVLGSCSGDRSTAPSPDAETVASLEHQALAAAMVDAAGWEIEEPAALTAAVKSLGLVLDFQRTEPAPGIAHYRWEISVGPDPRDRIALHRVVAERRPWRPRRTRSAVFLQHGDAKDFTGMFLPGTLSETTPDDFGAAIHWARAGLDVWGIDQAWCLVPADTEDLSFMADWGLDKQVRDLRTGIVLSRLVRLVTGNGFRKMPLLGYSSGTFTGYALLNQEAALPRGLRQVGSWISVDNSPVTDIVDWNTIQGCDYISEYQGMMDAGEFGYFVGFDFMGDLARNDPDSDSPVFPGFTNIQAALYLGAGPIFDYGDIHYLAGVWEDDLPVDLIHTSVDQWLDFMIAGIPWEPVPFFLDYSIWSCGETDVPWDDHFAEITVPVLNVAAAGGIGPTTEYCLTLLGGSDITSLTIQLEPDADALVDIGHIDLWLGDVAPELVWDPILAWVRGHTPGDAGREVRDD